MKHTAATIKKILSPLRADIRAGRYTVNYRMNRDALRNLVSQVFDFTSPNVGFTPENFNKNTLKRWEKLFDIPRTPVTSVTQIASYKYPSSDETAWALNNFINRRADPWAHVRPKNTTIITETQPSV